MVIKTTSNVKGHFKSGFAPLYHSLVTSLYKYMGITPDIDVTDNYDITQTHLHSSFLNEKDY